MNMYLEHAGLVFLFIIAIALLAIAYSVIVNAHRNYIETIKADAVMLAARRLGFSIKNQCYWFSEDEKTLIALELTGIHIAEYGGFDADNVRENWRRSFSKNNIQDVQLDIPEPPEPAGIASEL